MNEDKVRKKLMRKTKTELIDKIQYAVDNMEWDYGFDTVQFMEVMNTWKKNDLTDMIIGLLEMCGVEMYESYD